MFVQLHWQTDSLQSTELSTRPRAVTVCLLRAGDGYWLVT